MILASKGSPWAPEVIRHLNIEGVEIHLLHVDADKNEAYLDYSNLQVTAAFGELYNQLETVTHLRLSSHSKLRYIKFGFDIRRISKLVKPDLLLTLYGGGFSISAFVSGFRPYANYLVGSDVHQISGLFRNISKFTYAKASMLFCNGDALATETAALAPNTNIENLLLGVDLDTYNLGNPNLERINIICVRGFQQIYNNMTILKAIKDLGVTSRPMSFTFVAGGSELNDAVNWANKNLSSEQLQTIQFLGGGAPEAIAPLLKSSHIIISMSRSDGTSASLLEAMACGLIPIVSDIVANRPWVSGLGNLGKLIAVDDSKALARAIEETVVNIDDLWQQRELIRDVVVKHANAVTNMSKAIEKMRSIPRASTDSSKI